MDKSQLLESCIDSLEASVKLLGASVKSLDGATSQVSRLKIVLNTDKVFGLVPELDLENAKTQLYQETHPQIKHMVSKMEKDVGKLRRKRTNLVGKVDLQRVRLESASQTNPEVGLTVKGVRLAKGNLTDQKITRLKLLQNKKERLKYSLSRLNLQDKKARLSMTPLLPPP